MSEKIIETRQLYMRRLNKNDVEDLSKILCDEQTMYAYEGAFSEAEVLEWLEKQLARYQKYGFGLWAVILTETEEFIGQCGLTMQPWRRVTADISGEASAIQRLRHGSKLDDNKGIEEVLEAGYLFRREYWHNGYATEAARACMEYAFRELNAAEVCSIIRDTNTASQKVALRNGMRLADQWVKNYRGVDMLHFRYIITREEFFK